MACADDECTVGSNAIERRGVGQGVAGPSHAMIVSSRDFRQNHAVLEMIDFADEDGCYWMTSEHYFQAAKTVDPDEQFKIQSAKSPRKAKDLGQAVKFKRTDWNDVKIDVMRQALKYKFAEGSRAAQLLKMTGYQYLIEFSPWGDTFWGVDSDLLGHNWLGRLLNERRFQL